MSDTKKATTKPKNKGGRPPKYTPEEFAKKMDEFIAHCDKQDIDATDYQLITFFGISVDTLDRYRIGDTAEGVEEEGYKKDTYKGFSTALKKLVAYREDQAMKLSKANPKLAGHTAFRLKQRNYGGWTDKGDDRKDVAITVKIDAGSKDPFA